MPGRAAGSAGPLRISTSPRCTWVWADDLDTARQVRRITGGEVAYERRGQPLELVTDIDIGVDAYGAAHALAVAGFSFSWHESQHPLNRDGGWEAELPGMPEQG